MSAINLWNLAEGVTVDKDLPARLNEITVQNYYMRLQLLAQTMFKWEGLPDSVSARFLESVLYDHGWGLFFFDDQLGYLGLQGTIQGQLNHYREPIKYRAWSIDYQKDLDADDCVLIRNNYGSIPTSLTLMMYAHRLAEVERTIDVNISQQKTPLAILCDEKQRLTMMNIYKQYKGNIPVIFGDKSMSLDNFKVLKTDAPYVADKLMIYKHNLWNEAMTFLGINNANTDKKERLITDEAEANNGLVMSSANVMLTTREEAADKINKKYGLNVRVTLRENPGAEETEEPEEGE